MVKCGIYLLIGLVLGGCGEPEKGPRGVMGLTGPPGPTGPPGAGASYRWHDANGVSVTEGTDLSVFDRDDHQWTVDPETARLLVKRYDTDLRWATPNCGGVEMLISWPLPRLVFQIDGIRVVRPDDLPSTPDCYQSWRTPEGECVDLGQTCELVMHVEDLILAGEPPGPWAPPLHPEPL